MPVFASDDFTGSPGAFLQDYSAAWSSVTGTSANRYTKITTERRLCSHFEHIHWVHSAAPPSADYRVSADIYLADETNYSHASVSARFDPSELTGYQARLYRQPSPLLWVLILLRYNSGALTTLSSTTVTGLLQGGTYRLAMDLEGDTLRAYLDNGLVSTIVDESPILTPGRAGFAQRSYAAFSNTARAQLDNWQAETLSTPERQRSRLILTPW